MEEIKEKISVGNFDSICSNGLMKYFTEVKIEFSHIDKATHEKVVSELKAVIDKYR